MGMENNLPNIENEKTLDIKSVEELTNVLNTHGVDTSLWGSAGTKTKTVDHLLKELNEGECTLVEKGGDVIRKLKALGLQVSYKDKDGDQYILKEQHQFFLDNNRKRIREGFSAVSEKLKSNESPDSDSIARAISEELHIEGPFTSEFLEEVRDPESNSYPGLKNDKLIYRYKVNLNDEQYHKEGYVEVQKDKHTCFNWEKVSN